jgi:sugar phosphate permease
MWTPVITVVQRWFSPKKRGLALGIISTGYGLGFGTMGAAFPWIVQQFNWRFAWYFLGAAALVMFLFNSLLLRSDPASAGFEPWGQKERVDSVKIVQAGKPSFVKKVLKYKPFWIIGLSYFCIAYSLYGITTFMVDFAKYEMGLPLAKASFLATIHGVCQIIGVLTILPLSDYLGRNKTILISNFAITITLTGILFAGQSWIILYILVGILAVFYGVTFPIYGACAGDYFPRALMGTVIGAWTPFYGIGAILAHWVCGMLRDTTGSYSIAFSINAIMAALGFCFFLMLKRVRVERSQTLVSE